VHQRRPKGNFNNLPKHTHKTWLVEGAVSIFGYQPHGVTLSLFVCW